MGSKKAVIFSVMNRGRGSALVVEQQIKAFRQHGYRVSLVSPHESSDPEIDFTHVNLRKIPTPVHEFLPEEPVTVQVHSAGISLLCRYLDSYAYSMYEAVTSVLRSGIAPSEVTILTHHANVHTAANDIVRNLIFPEIKHVIQPHGTCIRGFQKVGLIPSEQDEGGEFTLWDYVQRALNRSDGLIAISEFVKNELITPLVDNPRKISVIPDELVQTKMLMSQDADSVIEGLIRDGEMLRMPYVIQAGVLNEEKNPLGLARASHIYGETAQTLFIGSSKDDYAQRTVETGKNCFYLGRVSDEVRNALLRNALFLVSAHKEEDFGLTVAEAASIGTPAIGFPHGGVSEIIEDGRTGWLSPAMDEVSLGQTIYDAINSGRELALKGEELARYTRERFSFENTTKKVVELVDRIGRSEEGVSKTQEGIVSGMTLRQERK